ncbi:MAG: alpha-N-acetylglucosaminidase [Phycisphaerae bacterium]|nr:alpha-N-acetylglucosaminidase [Phycisphaerae bacterium]
MNIIKPALKLIIPALLLTFTASCSKAACPPARDVLKRLIGSRADTIEIKMIDKVNDCDIYRYEVKDGKLKLTGSSPVALCRGFYDYLKSNELGMVSWSGNRIAIPPQWPDASAKEVISPYKHHYYFNVVTYGYTTAYWDWPRWQRELDWMAVHGIDMPLALAANEAIAIRVWKQLGLTDPQIEKFYVGPAHLPWQRMGCIINHDGPLPQQFNDDQVILQHKILDRMRQLGMKPVVPAFAGFVPKAITRLYPEVKLHEAGWGGWGKDHHAFLLLPDGPLFNQIGKMFIEEWEKEFGKCDYYLADSFNEMEIPAPKDDKQKRYEILTSFGKAVYDSIKAGNPDATWVMQGWMFGYQRYIWDAPSLAALISKVPDDKMLLLDLAVDYNSQFWHNGFNWDFYEGFFGKPWVYSVIPNMGGKTAFTGQLDFYAKGGTPALDSPNKGRLEGFGMAPEGIENNEVLYELIADMGWTDKAANLDLWLENYCSNRYGSYPKEIKTAWQLLRKSCFGSFTDHPRFNWQFRPGRSQRGSVNFNADFLKAVESFAACADQFKNNPLYQQDLLEFTAFYLGEKIQQQIQLANKALMYDDTATADAAIADIMEMFDTMDRLLESHQNYRLQNWIDFARGHGDSQQLKDYYEHNARRLVTVWGPPVDDYSARIWSGLIRDYYKPRWQAYFKSLKTAKPFDFGTWEENWVKSTGLSEIKPFANPVKAALDALAKATKLKTTQQSLPAGQLIGQWSPADISTDWQKLQWKIPASDLNKIRGIIFQYRKGAHRLDVNEVTVIGDGKTMAVDQHLGFAGIPSQNNFYKLHAPVDARANNECIIEATVRGNGGNDSFGQVLLIKKQ